MTNSKLLKDDWILDQDQYTMESMLKSLNKQWSGRMSKNALKSYRFTSRALSHHEISESRKIFADNLDYQAVKIIDQCTWPNMIDDINKFIKKIPPRRINVKNAITIGNRCLFGRSIDTSKVHDMSWLIHELTHVWHFQTMGWSYLRKALLAHQRLGPRVYDFGGEHGLKQHIKNTAIFSEFNVEQQGDIVKGYYQQLSTGGDTSTWGYFIDQIDQSS